MSNPKFQAECYGLCECADCCANWAENWFNTAAAESDKLRAELEQRRLRAARAVERLREHFDLRADCALVDDAAEDACAEVARLRVKLAAAEQVAPVFRDEALRRCGLCDHWEQDFERPVSAQGWCQAFNVAMYGFCACHGVESAFKSAARREVRPCGKCQGRGVIETGNNDLPCDCPAGSAALFNVAGADEPITGAELRRRHAARRGVKP